MGVTGLWDLLSTCGTVSDIGSMGGLRLAVDTSMWLVAILKAAPDASVVAVVFSRLLRLTYYGVRPVFVFDGTPPELKQQTLKKRAHRRDTNKNSLESTVQALLLAHMKKKAYGSVRKTVDPKEPIFVEMEEEKEEEEEESENESLDYNDPDVVAALPISSQLEIVEQQKVAMRHKWRTEYMEAVSNDQVQGFSELQMRNYLHTSGFNQELEKIRQDHLDKYNREQIGSETYRSHTVASGSDERYVLVSGEKRKLSPARRKKQVKKLKGWEREYTPLTTMEFDKNESWKCSCGETNLAIRRACSCGKVKFEEQIVVVKKEALEDAEMLKVGDDLDALFGSDSETWECFKCGESNPEEDLECCCGNLAPHSYSCSNCMTVLAVFVDICTECGTTLAMNEDPEPVKDTPAPNFYKAPSIVEKPTTNLAIQIPIDSVESESDENLPQTVDVAFKSTSPTSAPSFGGFMHEYDENGELETSETNKSVQFTEITPVEEVTQLKNTRYNFYQMSKHHVSQGDMYAKEETPSIPLPAPRIVTAEELKDMEEEQSVEISKLEVQKQQHEKASKGKVTNELVDDIKDLLLLFGFPWVDAPAEAEAQCAYLDSSGLVDGVVSNDSDVFLFGASNVFRNVFSSKHDVEHYSASEIKSVLGLNQELLVKLAMLLGSDYTDGVHGVGVVNSLEILKAFSGDDGLTRFKSWVFSPDEEPPNEDDEDDFRYKHRKIRRNWKFPPQFPSDAVKQAYLVPRVDKSAEEFSWGTPDFVGIKKLCTDRLGWNSDIVDNKLEGVMAKVSEKRITQTKISDFFQRVDTTRKVASVRSKRLKKAVDGLCK